ncbi:L,D-transpeptidase [Amaricoccus sp.]|uniref:L,D-transpeptidase n=1 Tax=Amaricoccus sp. TaxID=1872485 RepID=UPI001B5E0E42|nr:L,D-transpeptidase [Amaricoccus sp.]MBP7002072.1 L,D-transpeptidase [Amaricoccus sp.]
MRDEDFRPGRRRFAKAAVAGVAGLALGGPALAQAIDPLAGDGTGEPLTRRVSGAISRDWRDYFDSVENEAILADITDRSLHYWGADGFYRIYPTSVPMSEEMVRRGRTEIVAKRPEPEWRPTPTMIERNPDLPRYVGPGPDNPLGVRAMNLGWQYYLIHGGNDIRKIGRQSSSGCIGLYNEHILEVYDRARIGTPVLVI